MLMQTMPMPTAAESEACAFDEGEDAQLARRAAGADVAAFEALYRRHHRRVHGVILRLVGHASARAEDLTQEAFVRAWQKLGSFRFESAFTTWLHRLAVNVALMDLRSRDPGEQVDDEVFDALGDPAPAHCVGERADLERAISALPPRARAVLVLHDIEGWKHEDIGTELEMAVGTSKAQLHRARRLLRKILGENA